LINQFQQKGFSGKGIRAVGVAGTAGIVKSVSPDLSLQGLIALQDDWSTLTPQTLLERHPKVLHGREDVILAGLGILIAAMRAIGAERLEVSAGGIRHGMFLWLAEQETNSGS
jgi:exopolyphosphatase/pppGpp-phosphohydrolase